MAKRFSWLKPSGMLVISPVRQPSGFILSKGGGSLITVDADCIIDIPPDNFISLMKEAISWAEQEMTSERD